MSDELRKNFQDIDKDLSHSWIDLSEKVRNLSASLKLKAAGTDLSPDAEKLSGETARLCDHIERMHADVIDLLENIDTRIPIHESSLEGGGYSDSRTQETDEVEKEKIQIQRESHELRSDFKDVLKALFMWVDDPKERVKAKE